MSQRELAELEKVKSERDKAVGELTAISGGDGFLCGLIHGIEKPFVGGCGKHVSFADSYRCSDCTASFHRDCIREHFEMDDAVKNIRAKECWRKDCADKLASAERLIAEMREGLRIAKIRLNICLGRFRGCTAGEQSHEVSVEEIPAWIAEAEVLIKKAGRE